MPQYKVTMPFVGEDGEEGTISVPEVEDHEIQAMKASLLEWQPLMKDKGMELINIESEEI